MKKFLLFYVFLETQTIHALMVATGVSKLLCIHSALLHVSANHVAIFREAKYKVLGTSKL
jgi:hypothetical protein